MRLGIGVHTIALPRARLSCIRTPMMIHGNIADKRSGAFASAALRALSSTILLLGLIGDRRAR